MNEKELIQLKRIIALLLSLILIFSLGLSCLAEGTGSQNSQPPEGMGEPPQGEPGGFGSPGGTPPEGFP